MRWRDARRSTNVEDRRRMGPGLAVGGGVSGIVILLLMLLTGGDLGSILGGGGGGTGGSFQAPGAGAPLSAEDQERGVFVEHVLGETEDVWRALFQRMGKTYKDPKLILFRGHVNSACGSASSAVGPFYCPGDQQVYIDLSFFDLLERRLGAKGDFARAYVIAHEIGHHVQSLLGTSERVHREQQRVDKVTANQLSVRLELQADFYAGCWAHHAKRLLEEGDIEEAITAAEAIGDDTLQKQSQGHVVPDSFTHGSSAQRIAWFRHGFRTGDPTAGNTFDDEVFRRVDPGLR
jgi:predicted metalloprotease